jgi:hypothetical protein
MRRFWRGGGIPRPTLFAFTLVLALSFSFLVGLPAQEQSDAAWASRAGAMPSPVAAEEAVLGVLATRGLMEASTFLNTQKRPVGREPSMPPVASPPMTSQPDGPSSVVPPPGDKGSRGSAGAFRFNDYQLSGMNVPGRWDPCSGPITYRINVSKAANTAQGRASAISDVQEAFARISAATGLSFQYLGTSNQFPQQAKKPSGSWSSQINEDILVAWADQSDTNLWREKTWGVAWTSVRGAMDRKGQKVAQIVKSVVILDSGDADRLNAGFGAGRTRGALLLHELGHSVGLDHPKEKAQLMYPDLPRDRPSATFGAGDRAGLAKVGASQGCLVSLTQPGKPSDT